MFLFQVLGIGVAVLGIGLGHGSSFTLSALYSAAVLIFVSLQGVFVGDIVDALNDIRNKMPPRSD